MSEERLPGRDRDEAALDRALDRAFALARGHEPAASAASRALVDRIVAAAVTERASRLAEEAGGGRVVPLRRPVAARPVVVRTTPRRTMMQVAALLAASLVAGIYVGGLADSVSAVQTAASAFGLAGDGGEVFQVLAGDDTAGDLLEESL